MTIKTENISDLGFFEELINDLENNELDMLGQKQQLILFQADLIVSSVSLQLITDPAALFAELEVLKTKCCQVMMRAQGIRRAGREDKKGIVLTEAEFQRREAGANQLQAELEKLYGFYCNLGSRVAAGFSECGK